jgi:hypothetical protein
MEETVLLKRECSILEQLDNLRSQMDQLVRNQHELTHPAVIALSQQVDKLVTQIQRSKMEERK